MDLYINIPASIEHKIAWQHVANNRLNGFFSLLFDIRDRNTSRVSPLKVSAISRILQCRSFQKKLPFHPRAPFLIPTVNFDPPSLKQL